MSDVWQGPGWWLASDGKWYPADAEPGSVYEGDLPDSDAQPDVDASTQPPVVEPVEPSSTDFASPTPSEVAAAVEQDLAATGVVKPDGVPQLDEPAQFGGDPFAQMPAPVVEEIELPASFEEPKVGGWQAIAPEPSVEPPSVTAIPDDGEAPVREEGWTSAYEERQDTGAILDAVEPAVLQPAVLQPAVLQPDVEIDTPVVEIPDVEIPTVGIPEVDIPDLEIPDLEIPDLEIPDVEAPEVEAPEVEAPEVEIPDLEIPDVEIPDVEIPVIEAPNVAPPLATLIESPTAPRDLGEPIERNDAWRKPLSTDPASRPDAAMPTGLPDVVDLAIPDEPRVFEATPEHRNWGLVGGIVVGIISIALLAWLISSLFTEGDDTVESQNDTTSSSELSAPSSDDDAVTAAPSTEPDDANVSVFALRAGDCIVGDIGAGQVTKVTKVDCELAHQFEVYREALIDSSITAFDEEAISAYAEDVCRTSLEAYVPVDDERGLKFKFLQPTEDSWNQTEDPDRVITCLLFDDDAPLVGRAA